MINNIKRKLTKTIRIKVSIFDELDEFGFILEYVEDKKGLRVLLKFWV